jgi:hypothetical protein
LKLADIERRITSGQQTGKQQCDDHKDQEVWFAKVVGDKLKVGPEFIEAGEQKRFSDNNTKDQSDETNEGGLTDELKDKMFPRAAHYFTDADLFQPAR